MKILIVSGTKKKLDLNRPMRWYMLPYYFEKEKNDVKYLLKKDIWKTLFEYFSFKPDLVICVGVLSIIPIIFKKIGLFRKPIIFDWNDIYHEVMGIKYSPNLISYIELFCAKNSDLVTTPSKFLYNKCKMLKIPVSFIPHGCDSFKSKKNEKLKGNFKVIYVGELSFYKDVMNLIKAVEKLNFVDLYLVGKVNSEFKNTQFNKNIHFLGTIKHSDLNKYISTSDLAVVSSDQDSTLKMYVYMKLNKCILAKRGRINYILDHKETVYVCDDFYSGILDLYKNKNLIKKIENNLKKIKVLSWKDITKKYLKIIKEYFKF